MRNSGRVFLFLLEIVFSSFFVEFFGVPDLFLFCLNFSTLVKNAITIDNKEVSSLETSLMLKKVLQLMFHMMSKKDFCTFLKQQCRKMGSQLRKKYISGVTATVVEVRTMKQTQETSRVGPTEKVGPKTEVGPREVGPCTIAVSTLLSVTRVLRDFRELLIYGSQYDVELAKSELVEAQRKRAWSRVTIIKLSSRMRLSRRKTVFMVPQNYVSVVSRAFTANIVLEGAKGDYVMLYLAFKPSHIASISLYRASSSLPIVSLLIRGTLNGSDVVLHAFIGFVGQKKAKWFRIRIRGNLQYEEIEQFDPEQFKKLSRFYNIEEVVIQL